MNTVHLSYDLIPVEFRNEVDARRIRGVWIFLIAMLAILLGHFVFTDWLRVEVANRCARLMAAKVGPIIDIRAAAITQSEANLRTAKSIDQIQSARPDDSLLQTLASVTVAAKPFHDDILIDSIDIRLPLEEHLATNGVEPQSQTVAVVDDLVPRVLIRLRVSDPLVIESFLEALRDQPRLAEVDAIVDPHSGDDTQQELTIYAVPQATRVIP